MIFLAILAGGSSTRFLINKLFYFYKGKPLIMHIIDKLKLCKNIKIIAIASPFTIQNLVELGVNTIIDNLCIGPMGGIYIAVKTFEKVLVIGGDMPNIDCDYVEKIDEICEENFYACIPVWRNGYIEPLAAIYTNKIIDILEYGIIHKEYSIQKLLKKFKLNIKYIDIDTQLDMYKYVFKNINEISELKEILD